jgi:protein TonB
MPEAPQHKNLHRTGLSPTFLTLSALGLCWLSGCSAPPTARPTPSPATSQVPVSPISPISPAAPAAPTAPAATQPTAVAQPAATAAAPRPIPSAARNAKDYRKDAASHLYARHSQSIYKGRLPPMLEAVGVLNVDIDRHGSVKSVQWMRAPRHVPHVMQQIERMVKAAAPYPVPQHMSQVTYTDVWLWHKSGKFQLDTLTEGQD